MPVAYCVLGHATLEGIDRPDVDFRSQGSEMPMELRHLRYFLAVADNRNFTRAAAQCFVAQSALSEQIARLEAEVGAPLFARTSRAVRLTAAGEVLVPLARRILADVEMARAELDALAGLRRGRLRLGVLQAPASAMDLAAVLGDFHRRFPHIEFEVRSDPSTEVAAAVAAGSLDLAIVGLSEESLPASLGHELLVREPLVAVMALAHPLAGRDVVGVAELVQGRQFIHLRGGTGIRQQVDAVFARAGVPVHAGFEVSQVHDMISLAVHDVGVAMVPRSAATGRARAGEGGEGFWTARLSDDSAVFPVSVVYDADRLSPAGTAFLEVIREAARLANAS
jgi:DNA-binding transcriptional LysR family regulator